MSEAARRSDGQAASAIVARVTIREQHRAVPRTGGTDRLSACPPDRCNRCNRCGFPVLSRPWGCKNPCTNCGTVYPLGDCSD